MMNNSGSGLISQFVEEKFGTYLFNTSIVTAVAVPLFSLAGELGLRNSYVGLIVLQIGTAFGIFIVRQAYLTIPKTLEKLVYIDGENVFQVCLKAVLALIKPTLVTLGIYIRLYLHGEITYGHY